MKKVIIINADPKEEIDTNDRLDRLDVARYKRLAEKLIRNEKGKLKSDCVMLSTQETEEILDASLIISKAFGIGIKEWKSLGFMDYDVHYQRRLTEVYFDTFVRSLNPYMRGRFRKCINSLKKSEIVVFVSSSRFAKTLLYEIAGIVIDMEQFEAIVVNMDPNDDESYVIYDEKKGGAK